MNGKHSGGLPKGVHLAEHVLVECRHPHPYITGADTPAFPMSGAAIPVRHGRRAVLLPSGLQPSIADGAHGEPAQLGCAPESPCDECEGLQDAAVARLSKRQSSQNQIESRR